MDNKLNALIVEDSDGDAKIIVDTLRAGGFELEWAQVASERSMREALDRQRWDIIIADYTLPRFSGLEALSLVQERQLDLPLIIVSRSLDEDTAVATLHLGATDYVMKRNLGRLPPAIRRALREYAERDERRRAEVDLRKSEEKYRQLIENANDVVFTTDLAGNFTSLNRAGEIISGFTRDELTGMNMSQILTPEGYQFALSMIRRKLEDNRPTRYEIEMIARDGHLVALELSTQLIFQDGKPVGIQGIARDVTERRRADEELKARERKQGAVASLGLHALASSNLDTLFDDAAQCVTETLSLEFCTILELLPDGNRLLARTGIGWRDGLMGTATVPAGPHSQAGYTLLASEPVIVEDFDRENRFSIPAVLPEHRVKSGISVIIHGSNRPFGTLNVFSRQSRSFAPDDVHFLQAVANVLSAAVERKRLEEEREQHGKELASRIIQAQEEERKRISRELHDETAQTLSVLVATLDLLESAHAPEDPLLQQGFSRAGALARRALDETRALAYDLRPTILDDAGLAAALEWLGDEYERDYQGLVDIEVNRRDEAGLSPEITLALFRIAQEALTNSGKHSAASAVQVRLTLANGAAELTVSDNGRGFDPARVSGPTREGRLGLFGMRERATLLGGCVNIASSPGKGTCIRVEIPFAHSIPRAG